MIRADSTRDSSSVSVSKSVSVLHVIVTVATYKRPWIPQEFVPSTTSSMSAPLVIVRVVHLLELFVRRAHRVPETASSLSAPCAVLQCVPSPSPPLPRPAPPCGLLFRGLLFRGLAFCTIKCHCHWRPPSRRCAPSTHRVSVERRLACPR